MVVQVVPEGVDEVDGVVSGIGIGVTREQDWRGWHKREGVGVGVGGGLLTAQLVDTEREGEGEGVAGCSPSYRR